MYINIHYIVNIYDMKNDQRHALINNANICNMNLAKCDSNYEKKHGKCINTAYKSFNHIFIDNIDIENFKMFISIIKSDKILDDLNGSPNQNEWIARYAIRRKIYHNYKVYDIAIDNYEKLGDEYMSYFLENELYRLYDYINDGLYLCRDIIYICKKGFEKTKQFVFYYYLAHCIYKAEYKQANYRQLVIKYYNICITNNYEKIEMYYDLHDLYYEMICDKLCSNNDIKKFYELYESYYIKYKTFLLKTDYHWYELNHLSTMTINYIQCAYIASNEFFF